MVLAQVTSDVCVFPRVTIFNFLILSFVKNSLSEIKYF